MEVETLSKRLAEAEATRLVNLLADRLAEEEVDTLYETPVEVRLFTLH